MATALTLMAFEVGLRVFWPQKLYRYPRELFQNDPEVVFKLRPGFRGVLRSPEFTTRVRINSLALRGPEIMEKDPGSLRILGLGDSFVSALNVEEGDTFLAVSARWLDSKVTGRKVEVIHAGAPNYGTWHELRLLQRLAPLLNPDVVILCVYVGNDLDNNLNPREAVVRDGFLVQRARGRGFLPYPVRSWLQRNSMTYAFFFNAWGELKSRLGSNGFDPLASFRALVSVQPGTHVEKGYAVSSELLGEMVRYLQSRRIPMLVVLIPAELQVYGDRFERLVRTMGLEPSEFDLDLPDIRWTALARSFSVPVLDLLPQLRSHVSGPPLYMSLDGHFNPLGNRLTGEAIGEALLPLLAGNGAERP